MIELKKSLVVARSEAIQSSGRSLPSANDIVWLKTGICEGSPIRFHRLSAGAQWYRSEPLGDAYSTVP